MFPQILDRLKYSLGKWQQEELSKISRSPFLIRVAWPARGDVKYAITKRNFAHKKAIIRKSEKSFIDLVRKVPDEIDVNDAVKTIESFVKTHPFDDKVFNHLCSQLKESSVIVEKKQKEVLFTAKVISHKRRMKSQISIKEFANNLCKEVEKVVTKQVSVTKQTEDKLIKEAKKLALDLEKTKSDD